MGGSSRDDICNSGEDPESNPLSTVEIIILMFFIRFSVDTTGAAQQVMLEFCETVGIVGYLSSRVHRSSIPSE